MLDQNGHIMTFSDDMTHTAILARPKRRGMYPKRNQRLATDVIYQGLYETGQRSVAGEKPAYLVVAGDRVNFEKP